MITTKLENMNFNLFILGGDKTEYSERYIALSNPPVAHRKSSILSFSVIPLNALQFLETAVA